MLFNSIEFLFFFPLVVVLYYSINHKWRWLLLLVASYYFYMCWKPEYIILIVVSTLIDYFAGIQMFKCKEKSKRTKYVLLSLFSNLSILFGFKYFNFFNDSVRHVFEQFNIFYDVPFFDVLLPVGISFYTFQTLSYTIDIYRGERAPERHLGIFALYVSFFPQLVAGPIERSSRLIPQFYNNISFDYDRVTEGLKIMLWGFFKKLVIADRLANYVDAVYNNQLEHSGLTLFVATIFFAFQIYCDFSGYSDIAIGGAKVLGYDLMENFRRPYFARSISEFWHRWHISLSTWFRDYLYIPLGGNRVVKWRWYYNLFITFVISGLWHGANWTFVVWGALHGLYLILGILVDPLRKKALAVSGFVDKAALRGLLSILITFMFVNLTWIFFRANTISDAIDIVSKVAFLQGNLFIGTKAYFAYSIFAITLLMVVELNKEYEFVKLSLFHHRHAIVRHLSYATVIVLILLIGVLDGGQFIYFQF